MVCQGEVSWQVPLAYPVRSSYMTALMIRRGGLDLDLPPLTEHMRLQVRGDDTSPQALLPALVRRGACKAIHVL